MENTPNIYMETQISALPGHSRVLLLGGAWAGILQGRDWPVLPPRAKGGECGQHCWAITESCYGRHESAIETATEQAAKMVL